MQKYFISVAMLGIIAAFILSACGFAAANRTPTSPPLNPAAVYTAAAQTVFAQLTQQVQAALLASTFTGIPSASATSTPLLPTSPVVYPTLANCANASFITDVTIPDGTQLPANTDFTKTWRVQNTGTCPWTTSFHLVFLRGEAMGGQSLALPGAVQPGQQVDISVKLKVPVKTGKLTGVWVLTDGNGQQFGVLLTVVINVGALSPTPTGSVTATPTPTRTHTPVVSSTSTRTPTITSTASTTMTPSEAPTETSTTTPSETPVPSETPTETPTEIPTETPTPTTG